MGRVARRTRGVAARPAPRSGFRRNLALECARGRDCDVLSWADLRRGMRGAAQLSAASPGRDGDGSWIRFRRFLYFARGMGAAVGPNCTSRGGQPSPSPKFPLYACERSRFRAFQLEGVERRGRSHVRDCRRRGIRREKAARIPGHLLGAGNSGSGFHLADAPAQQFSLAQAAGIAVRAVSLEMAGCTGPRFRILCRSSHRSGAAQVGVRDRGCRCFRRDRHGRHGNDRVEERLPRHYIARAPPAAHHVDD